MKKELGIENLVKNYLRPYTVNLDMVDDSLYVSEIKDNLFGNVIYSVQRISFEEKCHRLRCYLDKMERRVKDDAKNLDKILSMRFYNLSN
jgi:hypothetical protein